MEKENEYFVVLRRTALKNIDNNKEMMELISIYDRAEALAGNWIDEDGSRVWIVPSQEERMYTFVWGFLDMDSAIEFYEVLKKNELGIRVEEA